MAVSPVAADRDYPQMIAEADNAGDGAPSRPAGRRRGSPGTVRIFGHEAIRGVAGGTRFDWDALDAWYEEDEQVYVHPRNPYVRVDALRSHRVACHLMGQVTACLVASQL
jgi:hypothetical protein